MQVHLRISRWVQFIAVISSFIACSGKGTEKGSGCPPVALPGVVSGEALTPTEVDVSVKLVFAGRTDAFARGFWESMTLVREDEGPSGERWTNDARVFTGAKVNFEPGPVITLHLDRSTAREPFGRPLRLHLRFENRHLTDCPGRTGTTDLEVGFVLRADGGPLRLTDLHSKTH